MRSFLWGGADCVELARTYGTPLYVIDESVIRSRFAQVRSDFLDKWPGTSACYASKAFLTRSMARIAEQEGLGLDVVSGGELHTALSAGFPPERIEMHGNSKSEHELEMALSSGIGRIVVDGPMELELLDEVAGRLGKRADIMLRVSPGVHANTHAYIATGHSGSKFGFPLEGDMLSNAVSFAMASNALNLKGLHFHVGSQIQEPDAHVKAAVRVMSLLEELKHNLGFEASELNVGGGFGVKSHPSEPHLQLAFFTDAIMNTLQRECEHRQLDMPKVSIEPGRWIISDAGITLYTVETVKRLGSVTYVGVDGGMADNPRPALYQAQYEALLANRPTAPLRTGAGRISVVGKCCETGDILIESAKLPMPERGDILAVFGTGAYNFSMASNYNRLCRPAVVLVKDGEADVIVERQSYEDLLTGDIIPDRLKRNTSECD